MPIAGRKKLGLGKHRKRPSCETRQKIKWEIKRRYQSGALGNLIKDYSNRGISFETRNIALNLAFPGFKETLVNSIIFWAKAHLAN